MTLRAPRPAARPLSGFRLLEALIAGWRPLQRLDVDGFALLRSRGITRRAHSAVALDAPDSEEALAPAIDRVQGLYEMAGESPAFRVLDLHGPERLDAVLAERGYTRQGESEVLTTVLDGSRRDVPHPAAEIRTGALDEEWFEAAWRLAPRDGEQARETLHDILAGTPSVQVLLRADGATDAEPVAVGRAALVPAGRSTAAVLNMIAVDPAHRRQGLGLALSRTLLALAAVQGADRALLEVERDNDGARALYRGLGLTHLGTYHYRVRTGPAERT
ncbi:GNAT family N-acetyltransferase [Brachybacterium sacelli]|uniref:Ribosomal protein S18 acetylase RimI-like enzyme n=1 Tax=Brachybacterium sacelli TaxID=173364 RepID=A0ABS4X602_9MICO|nr:N-acetyltransferase [Brachybacterium sacelli]MBP2383894.1 ribosomal protein S18 acetylase RimI-like enzyme [Brachybacterium sacelli]